MFSDKTIIGLDIGLHSIKMVELKHYPKSKKILTYGVSAHNLDLDGYWDNSKLRQLSINIEEIMKNGNFGGVKTIMGVQSKNVYVTTMDFDLNWSQKKIQSEIEKQAPYFLPYPPEEMRLSWSLITYDQKIQEYLNKQRVVIKAMPDFVIENGKNLLEHINLDGLALENQTVSQIRSSLKPDHGNTILVDVGAKQITFSTIVDGVLRSSSHIGIGIQKITNDLAKNLGIDEITAENFKKDIHLVNLFQLPKPVQDTLSIIKSELETFVELNAKAAQAPDKIVFTGGGVYTPGFIEFMKNLKVPVYFANPLRHIEVSDEYQLYISPIANQLSTAIGLALREDV